MDGSKQRRRVPTCPACGQPVTLDLSHLTARDTVKLLLVLSLLGYVILSLFLLAMSTPPELRRGCNNPSLQRQLDRCRPSEFDTWFQPLSKKPAFQIFVGGGLAAGVLIFYVDWIQNIYEGWQRNRGKIFQYECRHCGRQWN